MTVARQADLVIDENSTQDFQAELGDYLRRNNSGMPVHRLQTVDFANSSKVRLVQLGGPSAGIPGAECFDRDAKSCRALDLGEAEPRATCETIRPARPCFLINRLANDCTSRELFVMLPEAKACGFRTT